MYLESLKINGFKSFAKKTTFLFNDGITVVVGPNGCGKSNTVDAIRWVLGEQRAGNIRSEKMENVIFNGTKKVKPLGMAEVSLTIQNTKNVLPIEYAEVVITRRLFRSLESQYLLNNTPCRLKDIQNLFMDTGMGPNAYSIIELAMIETILSGHPEERRRIIEEAAGVTKYKLRRRAAFRKLEATEVDLLRVYDIINEVEKTVASLQRQVRKAKRYQDLRETLKEMEVRLATHRYSQILEEYEPLNMKLREMQDSRLVLSTKFDDKEAEIEEARRKLLESERYLSEQQRNVNAVALKIHKKEEEILVGRERRKGLEDARVKLHRDKEEIKLRVEKNRMQIAESKEALQQQFEKIQVTEADYQEKGAALNKMEMRVQDKNEQLRSIEQQRLRAVEGLTDGQKDEERVKTQLENINERLTVINTELEENKLLQKLRQEKADKYIDRKAELDATLRGLRSENDAVVAEMQHLTGAREQSKERVLERKTELQTLKERIDLLTQFIESYEDHPEAVQHILMHSPLNGGLKGTLADNLTVASEYRRAVETAIGEAAVSLIVEGTDQALECIELLKSEKKGAVTFFPLDKFVSGSAVQKAHAANLAKGEGVVDWAYNLVKCNDRYRPIVEALLADFLVVNDLQTAKQEADRLRTERLSLITLSGEIVTTWGPIRGGASDATESAIIGRKALIGELHAKLKATFKQLDSEENERLRIEKEYQKAFNREQDLNHQINAATTRLNNVEMQLAQLDFETKKDAELDERLQKEYKEQMQSQMHLNAKFKAISPSLNDLVDSKVKFEADLKNASGELFALEEQVRELREIAQESRVKLVDLKGEERHLQESIRKLQDFKKELNESFVRIEKEMASSEIEHGEIEKRISANKAAIQVDFDEHQTLEAQVHELEQTYLKDKEALKATDKLVRQIRDERDVISETLHAMELRVSELKMGAEKIKDRIKEEYEVTISRQTLDEILDVDALSTESQRYRERLNAMGPVNLLALKEYDKEKERFDFLVGQRDDLIDAENNLKETIRVINKTARSQFSEVFEKIQENFTKVFKGFFENGDARLKLADDTDPLETEIIIEADPKGRRISALTLLSGGEKTLTAISLLFAIYLVKPSPFCILDEVDAPLDDANIGRFIKAIREFAKETQFIIVTHNKLTMRASDCLYGVTMEEDGVSKVVSVNFKDMEGLAAA